MKVLVTGAAGFIGMHSCKRLLEHGHEVLGIDNLNAYYDPALKRARLEQLQPHPRFAFQKLDIADGYITVPSRPGWGANVVESEVAKHPLKAHARPEYLSAMVATE